VGERLRLQLDNLVTDAKKTTKAAVPVAKPK